MKTKGIVSQIFLCLILLTQTACDTGASDRQIYDSDMVLEFYSSRSLARAGEPILIRFVVKNIGSRSIVIQSVDTPVLDISIEQVGGPEMFSWSRRNPDKAIHRSEWKPGES